MNIAEALGMSKTIKMRYFDCENYPHSLSVAQVPVVCFYVDIYMLTKKAKEKDVSMSTSWLDGNQSTVMAFWKNKEH